jgi:hypothetical protein
MYDKIKNDVEFRKEVAEKAGIAFKFPSNKAAVGLNGPKRTETPDSRLVASARFEDRWRARRDSNSRPSGSKRNSCLHVVQSQTTKRKKTKGNRPVALLCSVPICMAFSDRSRTVDPGVNP